MRAKTGEGDSVRGKPFLIRSVKPQTGASRSSGVEKGAHDGEGETRTHQFTQIFACFEIPRHPSHLCPYSSRFFFFFLAPFDARPGPGYALAQARLMGSHPHQGPAIAGHTSKEQRKTGRDPIAMSVGLAVIAAAGTKGAFFPTPPLQGGLVN